MVYCSKLGRYLNGKKLKMKVCSRCGELEVQTENGGVVEYRTPLVKAGKEANTYCLLHLTNQDYRMMVGQEIIRVANEKGSRGDAMREVLRKALAEGVN